VVLFAPVFTFDLSRHELHLALFTQLRLIVHSTIWAADDLTRDYVVGYLQFSVAFGTIRLDGFRLLTLLL